MKNITPQVGYKAIEFGLNKPILYGKKIELKIPTGEVHKGQFAIVELSDILASHNESNFSNTEGYPLDANGENVNDRNYSGDANAQAKVREFAQHLEPDRLVVTSRTPAGTPIITTDGIVVSGNNRTMSLKLAVKEFPEKYLEYKTFLAEEITSFGFSETIGTSLLLGNTIALPDSSFNNPMTVKFENPVLVRIDYDFPAYNALELSKYNKDTKKSERPIDKALKLGKILESSDRCTSVISDIVGKYETFSEFYANAADQKLMKDTLVNCNILTTQELPAYFQERSFTEAGKELIENLLAGLVLTKEALYATNEGGARTFRATIITCLPVLTANKNLPEDYSLNKELNAAVLLQNSIAASKLGFADYMAQESIFGDRPDRKAAMLNRLLAAGRNKFKSAVEGYNSSSLENAGESLFGDKPTPAEIFKIHIEGAVPVQEYVAIDKMFPEEKTTARVIETNVKSSPKPMTAIPANYNDMPVIVKDHDKIAGNSEWESTIEGLKSWGLSPEDIQSIKNGEAVERYSPNGRRKIWIRKKETQSTVSNPFVGGAYFQANPDKILATQSPGTSRFGKAITVYTGDLDLNRIDAPLDFITATLAEAPASTVIETSVFTAADTNSKVVDNLQQAVAKSVKDVAKKAARKKAKAEPAYQAPESAETYTVREVWDMINAGISTNDLAAFMIYKKNQGRPILSKDWEDISGHGAGLYSEQVKELLVRSGHLFYYRGELQPAFLYLSGNVYDKHALLVGADKDNFTDEASHIAKEYGHDVLKNQIASLQKVFAEQYEKRLIIKGSGHNEGLIINPVSEFARKFKVTTLVDGAEFKWKKITASMNRSYGQPDYLAVGVTDREKSVFAELNLRDAFCYWLRTDDSIQFRKGVSYAEIIKIYVQAANKPASEAKKDEQGTYHGAELTKKQKEDAAWERLKSKTREEGDRLFLEFMASQLTLNDKIRLETEWNRQFNGYVPIDYNKVPVAFPCNRFDMGNPMEIKPEKREAVANLLAEGSIGIAYDVGVGKTPSAIFALSQFIEIGWATRPVLVVPNQTYKQWIAEFKKFAAHIPINEFYNLSPDYVNDWKDMAGKTKQVPAGSISIITYEGMKMIGLADSTIKEMEGGLFEILMQVHKDDEKISHKKKDRETEKLNSEVETLIGRALAKTTVNLEEFGFDFIGFDEAHALKKVFTFVKGDKAENTGQSGKEGKTVNRYEIHSGVPSYTGVKGFILCQYMQRFHKGNTLLLTATPFTNSPLEIYSMLSLIAFNTLKEMKLDNLQTFFENFIAVSYEMVINSRLRPERRQIITGFNNLIPLQILIRRFINYKTGDQVNVPRPNKIVLPLRTKLIDGKLIQLGDDEKVETILPLSAHQAELMAKINDYADGNISESEMCRGSLLDEEQNEDAITSEGVEINEEAMDADEKIGVRLLKAMNHARNLALSPYIFDCSHLGEPTWESYIETSNKLLFAMQAVASVQAWHKANGSPMSGQVLYSDRGVAYFPLIREYLIKKLGFAEHEVGIISSQIMVPTPKGMAKEEKKEYIKNLFLGKRFNEVTLEMEDLPDDQRMKILIGSSTIKEGINLQAHSSVLYDLWEDWNPTDVQQLEGRVWRQGNKFKTVRIVHPLMINSMDIFMFQKLEEKTTRINTIWQSDGRTNVLKTEDFNPKELKYSLIRDPKVLAQMELMETSEKLDEEIVDLENKIKRNKKIASYQSTINGYSDDLTEWLEQYRPASEGQKRTLDAMIGLAQDVLRKQTDSEGLKMAFRYEQKPNVKYSTLYPASKQYYFDELVFANRNLKRETRDYLEPNGLKIEQLEKFSAKLQEQIAGLREEQSKLTGEDAKKAKVLEIVEWREAHKVEEKSVDQVVREFAKLNYLLGEVKVPGGLVKTKLEVPLVDAEGLARIDTEALAVLDEAILHEPETKRLHVTEIVEGDQVHYEYTPERIKLHDTIINKMVGDAVCVEQQQPIVIMTGGAPGSGKSTFLRKYAPYMESKEIYKIDADEAREYLPEYKGWNSPTTHQETRDIINKLIDTFDQPCKHDVLYDGTMSNAKKYIAIIRRFRELGYKVYLAYMDIPKEESIKRALLRFRNNKSGKGKWGRYVPVSVIEEFFATGDAGYQELKAAADGYIKIDSLSGEVLEQGGDTIPHNRSYHAEFSGTKPNAGAESDTIKELREAYELLIETAPLLTGKDKKEVKAAAKLILETIEIL